MMLLYRLLSPAVSGCVFLCTFILWEAVDSVIFIRICISLFFFKLLLCFSSLLLLLCTVCTIFIVNKINIEYCCWVSPVTCENDCGIGCSWPKLLVRPSSLTSQRRSEERRHSTPEIHVTLRTSLHLNISFASRRRKLERIRTNTYYFFAKVAFKSKKLSKLYRIRSKNTFKSNFR